MRAEQRGQRYLGGEKQIVQEEESGRVVEGDEEGWVVRERER